jgi:nitroreductase
VKKAFFEIIILIERIMMIKKPAENRYPIHPHLRTRWSPRAFSAEPVELTDLLSLFEAARWSASSGNQQPWSFIVTTTLDPEAHQKFVEVLTGRNPLWAKHAPVLVLGVIQRENASGRQNRYAMYDLGQAVANLTFQATELGLSVRQMGGFDADLARRAFNIPETHEPVVSIAIGYAGHPEDLPEAMIEQELAPRQRKEIESFVFENGWQERFQQLAASDPSLNDQRIQSLKTNSVRA